MHLKSQTSRYSDFFPLFTAFVLAIFVSCFFTLFAHADSLLQTVRIGLVANVGKPTAITLSSKDQFQICDVSGQNLTPAVTTGEVGFTTNGGGIQVFQAGVDLGTFASPIRLIPGDDKSAFEFSSPRMKNNRYKHILEIRGGSRLSVVNELPLEDYIRGVIPIEVPKMFQHEAQKALVLAIRTYAITSLSRHKADGFNLCDNTNCQCFAGASREAAWVDTLIDETRGQIITYNGEPIHALYSTDCGGSTQNNEDAGTGKTVWPYLRAVSDSPGPNADDYCSASKSHKWSLTYTLDELSRKLGQTSKIGTLQSMEFPEYDISGRVKTVLLKGDLGESRITGSRFRDLIGLDTIKSTRLTLTVTPEGAYTIEGKGYGHGMGMCAFGANGMAKSDARITYVDILKHYYAGVDITGMTGAIAMNGNSVVDNQPSQALPDSTSVEVKAPTEKAPAPKPAKRASVSNKSLALPSRAAVN